ncbi:MAG TPA: hypothetical protein VGM80_16365 [Gaiellaceae bacterium]
MSLDRLPRRLGRTSAPVVAALLAVAVAGCGGGGGKHLTHAQYVTALHGIAYGAVAQDASRLFSRLAAGEVSAGQCRTGARRFARDIDRIVADVDALDPPTGAADLQQRFLVGARVSAGLIDKLAADVAAGRVGCGQSWNSRAYGLPSTLEAEKVLAEYQQRGYVFESGD